MCLLVRLLAFVCNLVLPVGFSYTLLPSGGLMRLILDGQDAEHPTNIYTYRLACVFLKNVGRIREGLPVTQSH